MKKKFKTVKNLFIAGSIDFENMNQAEISFEDIGSDYYISLTPSWFTSIKFSEKKPTGLKIMTGSSGKRGDKVDIVIIKILKDA